LPKHIYIVSDFFERAEEMREVFADRFRDPTKTHAQRCVWDFWHVRGFFTYIRTDAAKYFGPDIYSAFTARLMCWAKEELGINSFSYPWLSYYIHGCRQEIHQDTPNGPWSFVFSLTPNERRFFGGETLISNLRFTDYWRTKAFAGKPIIKRVSPTFNQLVVFDSRFPHGVSLVEGTMEPLEGRLVVHGWLLPNKYIMDDSLDKEKATMIVDEAIVNLKETLSKISEVNGCLALRLFITKAGVVDSTSVVANTLIRTSDGGLEVEDVVDRVAEQFKDIKFPAADSEAVMTIPIELA
jgi:hypothetical protein